MVQVWLITKSKQQKNNKSCVSEDKQMTLHRVRSCIDGIPEKEKKEHFQGWEKASADMLYSEVIRCTSDLYPQVFWAVQLRGFVVVIGNWLLSRWPVLRTNHVFWWVIGNQSVPEDQHLGSERRNLGVVSTGHFRFGIWCLGIGIFLVFTLLGLKVTRLRYPLSLLYFVTVRSGLFM